jgi:hypothetical protein
MDNRLDVVSQLIEDGLRERGIEVQVSMSEEKTLIETANSKWGLDGVWDCALLGSDLGRVADDFIWQVYVNEHLRRVHLGMFGHYPSEGILYFGSIKPVFLDIHQNTLRAEFHAWWVNDSDKRAGTVYVCQASNVHTKGFEEERILFTGYVWEWEAEEIVLDHHDGRVVQMLVGELKWTDLAHNLLGERGVI